LIFIVPEVVCWNMHLRLNFRARQSGHPLLGEFSTRLCICSGEDTVVREMIMRIRKQEEKNKTRRTFADVPSASKGRQV
jgi:hypothetical protein